MADIGTVVKGAGLLKSLFGGQQDPYAGYVGGRHGYIASQQASWLPDTAYSQVSGLYPFVTPENWDYYRKLPTGQRLAAQDYYRTTGQDPFGAIWSGGMVGAGGGMAPPRFPEYEQYEIQPDWAAIAARGGEEIGRGVDYGGAEARGALARMGLTSSGAEVGLERSLGVDRATAMRDLALDMEQMKVQWADTMAQRRREYDLARLDYESGLYERAMDRIMKMDMLEKEMEAQQAQYDALTRAQQKQAWASTIGGIAGPVIGDWLYGRFGGGGGGGGGDTYSSSFGYEPTAYTTGIGNAPGYVAPYETFTPTYLDYPSTVYGTEALNYPLPDDVGMGLPEYDLWGNY